MYNAIMDSTWVEHLIEAYSSGLMKYLQGHVRSREDAEDLLQDVFMSVYEHCGEFDALRCNEQAWLYIIAKRKLVSYYRANKQEQSLDEMEDWQLPGEDSMAEAANVMAARQAVAKGLSVLDDRAKEIIVLRYFEGLSADEVADRLGISPGNVRTIQSRALDKMNKVVGAFDFSD